MRHATRFGNDAVRLLLTGLAAVSLILPAIAAGDAFSGRWWTRPRIVERLGLTDSQIRNIEKIHFEHQERMIDLRAELGRANLELGRLLEVEELDDEALDKAIDRVVRVRCALFREDVESRAAVARVLDLAQRRMLRQLRGTAPPVRDRRPARTLPRRGRGVR